MDNKRFAIVLLIGSSIIFCSTFAFAETIVFKSGQTVDTKIIEKTDKYIKVEAGNSGTVLSYPIEQIERIDGKEIALPKSIEDPKGQSLSKSNSVAQESFVLSKNTLDTEYTEFNIFKIKLPHGWKVSKKSTGLIKQFTVKEPFTQNNGFVISYMPSNPDASAADILSEKMIKRLEDEEREFFKGQGANIDNQLAKKTFQNMPALRLDVSFPEQNQRLSKIYFIREGYVFTLVFATSISGVDLYNDIINDSVNTIELLPIVNQRKNMLHTIGLILSILSGPICYFLAKSKNRTAPVMWAIFGFGLSLIIVIILLIMPKREIKSS